MTSNGALDDLLARYEPALRRLAASYERDPALCEDLVQEMLFALFRALPTWRRECSERTFVYRVASNRALSHLASRRPAFDDLERAASVPDPAPLPEAIAAAGQQHEMLLAALRWLPVGQRQLLTMALEDLTPREIADVLGITENNVAVRLTRARAALRELMAARRATMTDTPNLEWDHWQLAWRSEPPAVAAVTPRTAELQRRLRRHRLVAWAYTVFDVCAAIALFAMAAYFLIRTPTPPVLVWSISVFVFTAIALAGAIWSRRDALVASAAPTADFLAALRLRLDRRERVPRFVLRLAAAEMAFGLAFYAIWSPDWLGRAARIYGVIALALAAWWRWYRRRLGRERTQLDALCREPEPEGAVRNSDRYLGSSAVHARGSLSTARNSRSRASARSSRRR